MIKEDGVLIPIRRESQRYTAEVSFKIGIWDIPREVGLPQNQAERRETTKSLAMGGESWSRKKMQLVVLGVKKDKLGRRESTEESNRRQNKHVPDKDSETCESPGLWTLDYQNRLKPEDNW